MCWARQNSAGMLRMAETSLDTAVEPSACPSLVLCHGSQGQGRLRVGTWKCSTGVSGAVVHGSLGLCGL